MITRTRKAVWGITHQLTLLTALALFPLALATERVAVPFGTLMHRLVDGTLTKYENATDAYEQAT